MQNKNRQIKAEAEYWNKKADHEYSVPDIRDLNTNEEILYLWDDPVIEDIIRGDYRKFIIKKALEKKNSDVLEIGCGTGWLSLELARAGMNVTGVDLSKKRIVLAQKYYEQLKKKENLKGKIDYIASPIQEMLFKKAAFDLIVCWDSLHHIQDIELVTKKIKQWLKPNGQLIIFEYIGLPFLNKIVIMIIYALPVINKSRLIKKIKHKIVHGDSAHKAPLEGITGLRMSRVINKYLKVKLLNTTLSISYYIAPYISGNRSVKNRIVFFLKRLDEAMIKLHLLRGQYIFLWATRNVKDR